MKRPDRITLRKWQALTYRDPRTDLIDLGRFQRELVKQGTCPMLDDLRARDFKWALEQKQAALFSYFVSYAILRTPFIAYAMSEDADYDCVLWWKVQGKSRYAPVQLKEVVPTRVNSAASVETELAKLGKYSTSEHTAVAIHINQSGYCEYSSIRKPKVSVAEIWLYASLTSDQSLWFLYGDLLRQARGFEIPWPT